MSLFSTTPSRVNTALLILRVVVGAVFVAHGAQKFFVYGLPGVTGAFGHMGVPGANALAPLAAIGEFFGGLGIIFGFLTRIAALGAALVMAGAIAFVKMKGGFFAPSGAEYELTLLAVAVTLMISGAGEYSIDNLIARRRAAPVASP